MQKSKSWKVAALKLGQENLWSWLDRPSHPKIHAANLICRGFDVVIQIARPKEDPIASFQLICDITCC
jgi:hypothetical protein